MITVRPLQIEDFQNGFLESLSNLHDPKLSPDAASLIWHNMAPNILVYVAEDDGKIVGCATLLVEEKFLHGGSKAAHVEDVATHKDHQGKGIGSLLQKHLIEEAKRLGCYKILLDCKESLIPFYEKFGYKESDKHMRLNLK
jgi:glucosamine-phosphate N-acetyltransferase